jgi:hypothetical protein
MTGESQFSASQALGLSGTAGPHLILQALNYVRGGSSPDGGAYATPTLARQKTALRQWAEGLGLLLDPDVIIPRRPEGGFLRFIEDTLAAGQTLASVRTVTTSNL